MKIIDWRDVSARAVAPLYAAQRTRWAVELDWDATANLAIVESARASGTLPGFVALNREGEIAGWTFYFLHEGVLQIGALEARSAGTARRLLDAVVRSPEALCAQDVTCFVLPDGSAAAALGGRRFASQAFLYLGRSLGEPARDEVSADQPLTRWRLEDGADTVRLLAAAYATSTARRCFAAPGRLEDWVHYVRQLIHGPGCGVFFPAASFAARDAAGRLLGVVLTTVISPRAAHVAQLVVDPARHRRGIGSALIRAASQAARSEGRRTVTDGRDDNRPALGLYRRHGFEERGQFLFGWRARPIRRMAA